MNRGTSLTSRYTLDNTSAEQHRLLVQSEHLRAHDLALLDRIEPGSGVRAIDVGCGLGGSLELPSERVGSGGRVVGIDLDPGNVSAARVLAPGRGLTNVELSTADARHKIGAQPRSIRRRRSPPAATSVVSLPTPRR